MEETLTDNRKPTKEEALLFKRLSTLDWYGVRDHVIKDCLKATNWNEVEALKYLQNNWIPPRMGYWCPRWTNTDGNGGGVYWWLITRANDPDQGAVFCYGMDDKFEDTELFEFNSEESDPTGHKYTSFKEADEALSHYKGDKQVFILCPNGQCLSRNKV